MIAKLNDLLANDPIKTLALLAALIAFATTPIAFAVLGRRDWFKARRGRVMMTPEFSSIVCGMMLVMGIPAIFAALVVKSQDFDKDRYEFDPNKTWSVLEQGREFPSVQAADKAVKLKMEELAEVRKNLVNGVKKLDEAMLTLRAASGQSPAVAQTIPAVLESLAGVRKVINLEGPQQLMDFTAPPAALPQGPSLAMGVGANGAPIYVQAPSAAQAPIPATPAPSGLAKTEADAELATVPEPQRNLASMLPMVDLPAGWVVTKYGPKHLETFNAENLYEKIDGRAESFTQNNVIGMAYASYHPAGDDSNEIQVYIFEFDHSKQFRAQSKYTTEKPDQFELVKIGAEGYSSAGSLLFYTDPYYTQIVSTKDDPKFAAIALDLARRIAAKQMPAAEPAGEGGRRRCTRPHVRDEGRRDLRDAPRRPRQGRPQVRRPGRLRLRVPVRGLHGRLQGWGRELAGLPPALRHGRRGEGGLRQVSRLRQAPTAATPGRSRPRGPTRWSSTRTSAWSTSIFRKGNVVGGVNGSTDAAKAEAFARGFVKSLPADLPKPLTGPKN